MKPATPFGSAHLRAPSAPRVYRRTIQKLIRRRERTGDLTSPTLFFTFASGSRTSRSNVTFVALDQVPGFDGEEAWFELELVGGAPWSFWRAVRRLEGQANA